MAMNGIDISAWQSNISIGALTTTDFVIVKATQGTSYVNEYFVKHIEAAIRAGKRVGAFHYANGAGAEAEAKHFLSIVKPYLGKILLALDWETGESASAKNTAFDNINYARQWLDYVRKQTGISSLIYMSETVAAGKDWNSIAKDYKLWGAQYPNYTATNYKSNPWMSGGWGAWGSKPTLFQYTSQGYITGYSGNLDLDLFYGSAADWDKLIGGIVVTEGWRQNSTGRWWQNADGSWPSSTWKKINSKWYYFDDDGYVVVNQWQWYKGNLYYLGSDGIMVTNKNVSIDADGKLVAV